MQKLILIKYARSVQLAHLYEHLFLAQVNQLFHDNNLFLRLDYSVAGATYHSGIVTVDTEAYTPAAQDLLAQLSGLDIVFNEQSLSAGFTQLLAEVEEPVGSLGYDKVQQALVDLHEQPWQDVDKLEFLDAQKIRRTPYPVYIGEGKPLKARKLQITFFLDSSLVKSHRELLPLFQEIAWFMIANCRRSLSKAHPYYGSSDSFVSNSKKVAASAILKVAHGHYDGVNLARDLDLCLGAIQELREIFDRYMADLRSISYSHDLDLAPSLESMHNDTLFIIGGKGWKKLATIENCELLLSRTCIELKFGHEKQSRSIVQLT
jgi:hypothetical protein